MEILEYIGDIPTIKLKQDYIRIENVKQYDLNIKRINPIDEVIYLNYWRKIKKIIIEGMWGKESGGYRFCPPSLVFYKNFGILMDTDEAKNTTYIRPFVHDLEWEQAYMYFEAFGFSGFYKDEEYTSDSLALSYDPEVMPKTRREQQLFNSKGKLKRYITPRENLRRLHEYHKGQPLYFNEARNTSILGSRGGGKSYFLAIAIYLQQLVTDGGQYYNDEDGKFYDFPDYSKVLIDKQAPKVELMLGSADTDKSAELFSKIVDNMNALATEPMFGVWASPDDPEYSPCPLFKDMSGSVAPGNKKNPYTHKYKIYKNGRELFKGTGSLVYHVSYSVQKGKGKGAQAGAGGRCKVSGVEEQGLVENYIDVMGSNASVVARNGVQFGIQAAVGTSGNFEAIQQTKKTFLNPQDYNILSYDDVWENSGRDGKIGFFLPFYMTLRQFKDEDGNTNYRKAFRHIYEIRVKKSKSSDPKVLRDEQMNRPIVPSEMWITQKGHYLPHFEASLRERELGVNNKYLTIGTPVNLIWDSTQINRIRYEINTSSQPFYEYPIPTNMKSYDSSIVIYDFPKHNVPNDYYFLTCDPYVAENVDRGGSFGATHVWLSPKYWNEYMPKTGPIVATYIAKPTKGLKHYYEVQERLIAFYGSPLRGLAYEANRGEDCKNYYTNKGKAHVLALRPQIYDRKSAFGSRLAEYGYHTTDVQVDLGRLNDLLLTKLKLLDDKLVIETIPCMFTIKQISLHDFNDKKQNLDALSSLMIAPKHIGVIETTETAMANENRRKNALAFLSKNKFLENRNSSIGL